jgi:hypothetical protein
MLTFSGGLKVFLAVAPCDLRKSFNGLHALASEHLGEDPRTGALFVFIDRRHSRLKIYGLPDSARKQLVFSYDFMGRRVQRVVSTGPIMLPSNQG